ncbi:MAG: hypothetical protein RLZZ399_2965, partial [Verrucomicrobiota bacterium]
SRRTPSQPTLRPAPAPSPFRPAPLPVASSPSPQIIRSEPRIEPRSEPQWTLTPTRTQATVLHCEILNAAQLSRSLPPKDFAEIVNRLLGICAETTAARNGEMDRADSESFRAFFKQTASGEQHAQAAVHAALALRTRLQSLSDECELKSGCELDARIGISTGEVLLANFGPLKNQRVCVAGETSEWSRRLACANQLYGSKILVSSQTRRLAESAVELRSIDLLQRALPPEPPEEVFELLALAGTLSPEAQTRLQKYREGVAHLRLRNWSAARKCLRDAQPAQSTDDAIDLLVHRINEQEALAGLVLEED